MGGYPLERLKRVGLDKLREGPRAFEPASRDATLLGSVGQVDRIYLELFAKYRDGPVAPRRAPIDVDPETIAHDLKAAGYFLDATMMGACDLPRDAWAVVTAVDADQRHALVVLVEHGRPVESANAASAWIKNSDTLRSTMRALEIANVLAGYIRNLGWGAKSHAVSCSDVDIDRLVVRSGLGEWQRNRVVNPFLGDRFAAAIVTTVLPIAPDLPLAPRRLWDRGPAFWFGLAGAVPELERRDERRRPSHWSRYPMERIKTKDRPTTLIIDEEVPRVSKRAAFFERALRGDLGPKAQAERTRFAVKHPLTFAMRGMQASMVPMQDGPIAQTRAHGTDDADANARAVKALCYWMGVDLAGICAIPRYAWFSHKENGTPITPYHKNAIVILIDQGFETMEGASGDDWMSGSQSMRGYMRGAEITGIVAEHIRSLGYGARAQTNIDSDVLHIPLILRAGLGEMSRIGELVLNPYVGPRFKSAAITTDLPLTADKPIDFGLQDMCAKCNKCARECPCDAIPWGHKIMFNGYETWKPDVERCARYRLTNPKGAACGRCMKTCPYNHEGLLYHRFFLWLAIHIPALRGWIARLDDRIGNGRRNLVKKWWRDLEWHRDGYAVTPRGGTNARDINLMRKVDPSKQKLALYPADAMPVPNDTNPQIVDRKRALAAAAQIESPAEATRRRAQYGAMPSQYVARPPHAGGPRGPEVEAGRSGLAEPVTKR